MIKTVKQACKFNPVVSDYRMAQGVEDLAQLIADEGNGQEFFNRNYVTRGMEQLFREGMLRLSGKSDQAVFELSQAMGGGKTHMMIALGLLARHPELRDEVLDSELAQRVEFDSARIAAFNGKNTPDNFIWGEIADQLGKEEEIKPFWANGPKAVDQKAWKEIIGNEPTLILLDELPPYLSNASTHVVGKGTLATMVSYSLSTLMSAALELPRCCIVISNLTGSYKTETQNLRETISNLQQETRRQSMTITPVQLSGNEIYEILKKRLIDELPDDRTISDVAESFAHEVKKAEDGGYITAASIEQMTDQIRETYPFHPSYKHIVALFKENEEFRQTRGLMQFTARLLKSVDQRQTDDVFLVGTQHLDLNDLQVRDEIDRINSKLAPAISKDVADDGNSIAEYVDGELDSDAGSQVMTLLLASSLSRAVGGRIGLSQGEIIEFLSSPNRKPDEFLEALQKMRDSAWYLHREDERFFLKETENLRRRIERDAKDIPQPKIDQAFIKRLTGILQPERKKLYQELQVLPKLDDINLSNHRVLIVIKPDGMVPPSDLKRFFEYQQEKNNLLVLTGEDSHMADAVEDRLRKLYAIEQLYSRMKSGDTLYEEARDYHEESEDNFHKSLSAAYNRVYFPGLNGDGQPDLLFVTIDNGLKNGNGENSAEVQLEKLFAGAHANYKFVPELTNEYMNYWVMAEQILWPGGSNNRRTPWRDVLMRARNNPGWPWMPSANGMEMLKNEALKQGRWRIGADGYIEKGPFPKEKTDLNVTVQSIDRQNSEIILTLTPRNAGDNPIIYCSTSGEVSEQDTRIDDPENYRTNEPALYFLVKDQSGTYETGEPVQWTADIDIRHQFEDIADKRKITLQSTPKADMYYTLDGSNPKNGTHYEGPFEIDHRKYTLMVYAVQGEASNTRQFQIPEKGQKQARIDDTKPAAYSPTSKINLDTTDKVFSVLNKFKDSSSALFKGLKIEIGEGENTVTVRFQARELSASAIESIVQHIREVLHEEQSQVHMTIGTVSFDSGFELKEFAEKAEIELKPNGIIQE